MNFRASPLAVAIMAATSISTAVAEDTEKKSATLLNQITVTATRTEQQLKDVASSVTVIDSEQIEQRHAKDIKDLVRYEPGVAVNSGSRTGHDDFNIRGMSGNRIKVLVDGVNQASNFQLQLTRFISGGRNFVDLEALKAVEIVKGPASSLYGSDAIGGIVAFQTKDPADILNGEGDLTSGSVKTGYSSANKGFIETLSLANRSDTLESMIIITRRDSKETETFETSGDDIGGSKRGEANPSDNRVNNLLSKVQLQLNVNHRIGFTGEYFDMLNKVDVRDASPSSTTGKDTEERTRIGFQHHWDNANYLMFDDMSWQLDWQRSLTGMGSFVPSYQAYYGSTPTTLPNREQDYRYEEKGLQFHSQFTKEIIAGNTENRLIYGLHIAKDKVSNDSKSVDLDKNLTTLKDYIPHIDRYIYGLFLQNELTLLDNLTVTPGIRYDRYNYKPSRRVDGQTFERSSDSAVTGKLGAVYRLNGSYSLFAQFSQGFKAPDLIDMFYTLDNSPSYKLQANPNLKPETSDSFEVGLRGSTLYGDFEITGFYNTYEDFIATVTTTPDPSNPRYFVNTSENLHKARIKGIELKGQIYLDELNNSLDGFTLNSAIAWAKGEGEVQGKMEPLNSVSPLTATIGLAYEDQSEDWGGELLWSVAQGKSKSDISNADSRFASPGYGVIDITAHYDITQELSLNVGLFNITDKKYWIWNDVQSQSSSNNMNRFSQPGRNFSLSAKYEF